MKPALAWALGTLSLLMALVYWLLPSRHYGWDIAAGVGYFATAAILIPPSRRWLLTRVLHTEWTDDVLLRWVFICVLVGAGCAYFTPTT